MKILTLLENTAISHDYLNKHGLSFYVETEKHKILVDLGPDESFLLNAAMLGVNIEEIDSVFISHGHSDHGGGLLSFIEKNNKAKIYIRKEAFDNYFVKTQEGTEEYIGIDQSLKNNSRIVFTEDFQKIDEELTVFSNIKGRKYFSTANKVLLKEAGKNICQDDFNHEQCLVITQNSKAMLMGGCAHNGIVNILDKFVTLFANIPHYVISGFHLYNPTYEIAEEKQLVEAIAHELCKLDCQYYTCHCTGSEPFKILEEIMGDKIKYLSTGSKVDINL